MATRDFLFDNHPSCPAGAFQPDVPLLLSSLHDAIHLYLFEVGVRLEQTLKEAAIQAARNGAKGIRVTMSVNGAAEPLNEKA